MVSRAPVSACPRCGYDVSGAVPTWKESCPLDGRCSECGLGFAWVDIFRPERVFPRWSFEHARRGRASAWIRTWAKCLRPARLWSEMPLAAPIERSRLVIFALVTLLLTYAVEAATVVWIVYPYSAVSKWIPTKGWQQGIDWNQLGMVAAWPLAPANMDFVRTVGPLGMVSLIWGILVPLPYLVLVETMRKARCRPAHLLRGWIYFLPTLGIVLVADAVVLNMARALPGAVWGILPWNLPNWIAGGMFLLGGWWYVRWWSWFTIAYLRIEHSRLVLTLMMTISFLASMALCVSANQSLLDRVLDQLGEHRPLNTGVREIGEGRSYPWANVSRRHYR